MIIWNELSPGEHVALLGPMGGLGRISVKFTEEYLIEVAVMDRYKTSTDHPKTLVLAKRKAVAVALDAVRQLQADVLAASAELETEFEKHE